MTKATLYAFPLSEGFSAPDRLVAMTLDTIGLDYDYIETKPFKDTATPEFIRMNIQHNVPVFVDSDGFTINESKVIVVYLAQKYDKAGKLFPNDVKTQAIIHHRLALEELFRKCFSGIIWTGNKNGPVSSVAKLKEILGFFEHYIKESKTSFIAGTEEPCLADFALLLNYTALCATKDELVSLEEWPMIGKWAELVKATLPNYDEATADGIQELQRLIRERTNFKI